MYHVPEYYFNLPMIYVLWDTMWFTDMRITLGTLCTEQHRAGHNTARRTHINTQPQAATAAAKLKM